MNIDPKKDVAKITSFIQDTLKAQELHNVIIALSGGTDSTTSLYLLAKAVKAENIFVVHMPYKESHMDAITPVVRALAIPKANISEIPIESIVDEITSVIARSDGDETIPASPAGRPLRSPRPAMGGARDDKKIRLGNIMARARMIITYDLAKKHSALVCGTENRSEHLLGYYTRFGDEASDFEPIRHLYKTQVYQLAKHLGVPADIIDQKPTAGLWQGQTDEGEFGFTYEEADQVLYLYFDKRQSIDTIEKRGFSNAKKIIEFAKKNAYKHHVPYVIDG